MGKKNMADAYDGVSSQYRNEVLIPATKCINLENIYAKE